MEDEFWGVGGVEEIFFTTVVIFIVGIVILAKRANGILRPLCERGGYDTDRVSGFIGRIVIAFGFSGVFQIIAAEYDLVSMSVMQGLLPVGIIVYGVMTIADGRLKIGRGYPTESDKTKKRGRWLALGIIVGSALVLTVIFWFTTFPRKSLPVEEVERLAAKGDVVKVEIINGTGIVYVRDSEAVDSVRRFRMWEYEEGTFMPAVQNLWENNQIAFETEKVSFLMIFELCVAEVSILYGIFLILRFVFRKVRKRKSFPA